MKNGYCRKCNSTEIYLGKESRLGGADSFVHLPAIARNTGIDLMMDSYVFANYGYVDMHIAETSKAKLSSVTEDKKSDKK